MIVHAGLVAAWIAGRWRGVLIEGPSGAGKSDLALRLIDQGWRLVADDRVVLWTSGGALFGRAPDALFGLIEARGVGVVAQPALRLAEIVLVLNPGAPERMPAADTVDRLGLRLPARALAYQESSAPAKVGRAVRALYLGGERRI